MNRPHVWQFRPRLPPVRGCLRAIAGAAGAGTGLAATDECGYRGQIDGDPALRTAPSPEQSVLIWRGGCVTNAKDVRRSELQRAALERAERRHAELHRVTLWLTLAYLIVLAFVAFWPTPVDQGAHGAISSLIRWLHAHGAPAWVRYSMIEFGANIAMFVPVGLFVAILAGARRWWLGILVGFLASCAIEVGQLAFLPTRFATVYDVIANTSGAVIGAIIALLALRFTYAEVERD